MTNSTGLTRKATFPSLNCRLLREKFGTHRKTKTRVLIMMALTRKGGARFMLSFGGTGTGRSSPDAALGPPITNLGVSHEQ